VRFRSTEIPGVLVIEPAVYQDRRGFFMETWHREKFRAAGLDRSFVQDNHSGSIRHALRGLHYQLGRPQGMLVRVVVGEVFDVATRRIVATK
jgi:dTDP-4-dehydrorhamnose 3,5-epimerase